MKHSNRKLYFNLFDGEGGGEGASTSGGLGTEARAFAESMGFDISDIDDGQTGSEDSSKETVEYGLPEDEDETVRVGDEQTGAEGEELDAPTGAEGENPEAEFNQLIGKGGKFEKLFGQRVSQAVNNRFKHADNIQGKLDATNDAIGMLYAKYGLEVGDTEGLKNAIERDGDLYKTAAEAEGLSDEKYKENLRLKMEAQTGRTMMEEYRAQAERQKVFDRWNAEADELKETFPSFDLTMELADETFQATLNRVGSVRDAFMIMHMQDILSGSMEYSGNQARDKVIDGVKQRASRPPENGATRKAAITRKTDPSKLTNEDMDKIFDGVASGKTYRW